MQWPKENGQKDKQRSQQITKKTNDRATGTPLKTRGESNIKYVFLWKYGILAIRCNPCHTRCTLIGFTFTSSINTLTLRQLFLVYINRQRCYYSLH